MKQLEVKTKTEDDALFVLCSLYWELSGEKEFAHELIDIAALTVKGKDDVWLLAMRFSVAHMPGWSCPKCGQPHYFSSREHFSASEKSLRLKPLFCSSCLSPRLGVNDRRLHNLIYSPYDLSDNHLDYGLNKYETIEPINSTCQRLLEQ